MSAPATSRDELGRTLGFHHLLLPAMGTVIGSGILLVPGVVLRQTCARLSHHTLLFVASVAVLGGNTVVAQPTRAAVGIAVMLTGLPASNLWRAKSRQVLTVQPAES